MIDGNIEHGLFAHIGNFQSVHAHRPQGNPSLSQGIIQLHIGFCPAGGHALIRVGFARPLQKQRLLPRWQQVSKKQKTILLAIKSNAGIFQHGCSGVFNEDSCHIHHLTIRIPLQIRPFISGYLVQDQGTI